jgi:hypothetical protein
MCYLGIINPDRLVLGFGTAYRKKLLQAPQPNLQHLPMEQTMHETQFQKVIEGIGAAFFMGFNIVTPFLYGWRARWGAKEDEVQGPQLGDDLVEAPRCGFTHAIQINAPADKVWPWVVQISQNKGGFYSYEWLENLVGCQIHNAEQIHPEWQDLKMGDGLTLHPSVPGLPVAQLEPGQAFVIYAGPKMAGSQAIPNPPEGLAISWLFMVTAVDEKTSRFISRWRVAYKPGFVNEMTMGRGLLEPIASVMDRRMLIGVRDRAEKNS